MNSINFYVNILTFMSFTSQSVSEDPLAQSQGSVSTQHRERGPAFPGQRARVSTLLFPPHPAARGLLQVHSLNLQFLVLIIFEI